MPANRKRLTRTRRSLDDAELIRGYINGEYSADELDEAAGNEMFWLAITSRNSQLGRLAAQLWQEHGPRLLGQCKADIPEYLRWMINAHGWPGPFPALRTLSDKIKRAERAALLEIATQHRRPK